MQRKKKGGKGGKRRARCEGEKSKVVGSVRLKRERSVLFMFK